MPFYISIAGGIGVRPLQVNKTFYATRQAAWEALQTFAEAYMLAWKPTRASVAHGKYVALHNAQNAEIILQVNTVEVAE